MALVASDWTVTRSTGVIAYIGGDHDGTGGTPSYATVIEFHRWLSDLADDASSVGDDELDMTDELGSKRDTDNIIKLLGSYTIGDVEAEHLYDGSISHTNGDEQWDGIVNYGNADVQIQIHQDGTVLADDWWNYAGGGLNADSTKGISHRFMIKVIVAGVDTDNRVLLGTTRVFGKTYGAFKINGTSRGNNTLALVNSADLNNTTAEGVVSGWIEIANLTEGYSLLDINNDGTDEEYYSQWTRDAYSINQFYERMKWLTRDGSVSTLYGLNGELFRGITHQCTLSARTGTFSDFEAVDWVTGTGQMFAIDSVDAGTILWLQLLTGVAPVSTDVITGVSTATATVDVVTDREALIQKPFVGASTGSSLVGSYGLGMKTLDTSSSDKFFELLNNSQIVPPNNVTFTVNGVVVGEDRVGVSPWDGVSVDAEGNPAIEKDQLALDVALTTDGVTSVSVVAIPSDTPSTGTIRIHRVSGGYTDHEYTNWDNATNDFTIVSSDFASDNSNVSNNIYIDYLSLLATATSEDFTFVYDVDRKFVVLVRDGGSVNGTPIKQFISSATMGINGGSISVIRTPDL